MINNPSVQFAVAIIAITVVWGIYAVRKHGIEFWRKD